MATGFEPPATIEETVKELIGLKAGTRTAVRGSQVLTHHVANQVAGLYELAGADDATADAMASSVRARGGRITEALQQISDELTAIGGLVARAAQANDENNAKRKVAEAKTGTRATRGGTTGGGAATTLNV